MEPEPVYRLQVHLPWKYRQALLDLMAREQIGTIREAIVLLLERYGQDNPPPPRS